MQKHVNLVDLVKSFPTNIFLQNLASIQKRTSPIKFDRLSEKSDKNLISNLSTKERTTRTGTEHLDDLQAPEPVVPEHARVDLRVDRVAVREAAAVDAVRSARRCRRVLVLLPPLRAACSLLLLH